MKSISFTIHGNQEDPGGNPIPYYRVTSMTKWSKGTKRYHAWADYVRAEYFDAIFKRAKEEKNGIHALHDWTQRKPIIATKKKAHMKILIHWKNEAHGDCDNIWKGIADALFMNDKYVSGEFDYMNALDKKGAVQVEIKL